MSRDERESKAILKQREIDEIRRLGLPLLKPGMSPRAVAVELKRASRRAEIHQRIAKSWEEEKRALHHTLPEDPTEAAARAVLRALKSGGDQRRRAEEFLKSAHPLIKAKMLELEGANSQWKKRRSNQRNGY